jgi:hypothetical protein
MYSGRYVRRMGEAMIIVREYINEMEALVARSVLEAHGIPAVVLRDDAGGMLPSMHLIYPARLAVRRVDSAEALRLLDAPFDGSEMPSERDDDIDLPGVP